MSESKKRRRRRNRKKSSSSDESISSDLIIFVNEDEQQQCDERKINIPAGQIVVLVLSKAHFILNIIVWFRQQFV